MRMDHRNPPYSPRTQRDGTKLSPRKNIYPTAEELMDAHHRVQKQLRIAALEQQLENLVTANSTQNDEIRHLQSLKGNLVQRMGDKFPTLTVPSPRGTQCSSDSHPPTKDDERRLLQCIGVMRKEKSLREEEVRSSRQRNELHVVASNVYPLIETMTTATLQDPKWFKVSKTQKILKCPSISSVLSPATICTSANSSAAASKSGQHSLPSIT